MEVFNVGFDFLLNNKSNPIESLADEIILYDHEFLMARQVLDPAVASPIRLDATAFILCKYGEISFSVDYTTYRLSKGSLLVLTSRHIIDNIYIDNNCEVFVLIISQKLTTSIVGDTPAIKKMIEFAMGHFKPILLLTDEEMRDLTDIFMRIKKYLKKLDHIFQSHIVKNDTSNFIMEIADILQKQNATKKMTGKNGRKDEVIHEFIRLLFTHCKQQHEVAFYANRLCVTPVNLSRIVMAVSGKSPKQWISDALVAEAKILLRRPDSNIKQVSDELYFGDQSSFGKFFRKHTGFTPLEYRGNIQEKNQ